MMNDWYVMGMDDGFKSVLDICSLGSDVLAVMLIRVYDGESQPFIAPSGAVSIIPTTSIICPCTVPRAQASSSRKEEHCSEALGLCEASINRLARTNSHHEVLPRFIHRGSSSAIKVRTRPFSIRPCKLLRRSQGFPKRVFHLHDWRSVLGGFAEGQSYKVAISVSSRSCWYRNQVRCFV